MTAAVFSKILTDLEDYSSPPELFFGGYGEPLSHPDIMDMIHQAAALGIRTSLITNGTLLSAKLIDALVRAGLDKLWISIDSSHQEAHLSAAPNQRRSSEMDPVLDFLISNTGKLSQLDTGMAIVLDKNNQSQVTNLVGQGQKIGIKSIFITNLEAYSPVQAELLPYELEQMRHPGSWWNDKAKIITAIQNIVGRDPGMSLKGVLTDYQTKCPFAKQGFMVIRWDGEISPCLPLLYDRTTWIGSWKHNQYAHSLGNILDLSLREVWTNNEYSLLRDRLLGEDFSPCLSCRDCWLSDDNRQDCMGFEHPTCGGCLWAAGLISCP
jgi:MoaA/NifB/PqqE/SkfB family radical SAM enzyme